VRVIAVASDSDRCEQWRSLLVSSRYEQIDFDWDLGSPLFDFSRCHSVGLQFVKADLPRRRAL